MRYGRFSVEFTDQRPEHRVKLLESMNSMAVTMAPWFRSKSTWSLKTPSASGTSELNKREGWGATTWLIWISPDFVGLASQEVFDLFNADEYCIFIKMCFLRNQL